MKMYYNVEVTLSATACVEADSEEEAVEYIENTPAKDLILEDLQVDDIMGAYCE